MVKFKIENDIEYLCLDDDLIVIIGCYGIHFHILQDIIRHQINQRYSEEEPNFEERPEFNNGDMCHTYYFKFTETKYYDKAEQICNSFKIFAEYDGYGFGYGKK